MAANLKFVFLLEKNSEVEPIGLHFGPLTAGISAHIQTFFRKWGNSRNSITRQMQVG